VRGGFAGDLEFSSPQDRATWFAEYHTFLENYARLATRIHADILCVGGELAKLTPYSDDRTNGEGGPENGSFTP
jgi:hypothetical protein